LGAGDEEKYLGRCRRVGEKERKRDREHGAALGREYGGVEVELASIGEASQRSERARA